MSSPSKGKAYFALFLTSFIWGTTWIASKLGIVGIHPLFYAGIRQVLAGTCFILFFIVRRKAVWPTPRQWGYLVGMAFLLFVISNAFTLWSLKYISSGLSAILGAMFPLWVAIIDWIIGDKDRPHLLSVVGLVLGLLGVTVIFYEHIDEFSSRSFITGILLQTTATLAWAIGTVIMSRRTVKLDRYYSLGWQMLLGGIMLNVISFAGGLDIPLATIQSDTWISISYMIVFGSIIAFSAMLYSLQHLPTTLASVYAYINPIVAVVLGHYLLSEKWSIFLFTGAVVTLVGVYMVNSGFRKYMKDMKEREDEVAETL